MSDHSETSSSEDEEVEPVKNSYYILTSPVLIKVAEALGASSLSQAIDQAVNELGVDPATALSEDMLVVIKGQKMDLQMKQPVIEVNDEFRPG